MSLKSLVFAPLTLLTLAACAGTTTPPMDSANVYRASEANRAMRVANCSVVQSRYVAVVDDTASGRNSINQLVGIGAGALIGNAIGDEIGGNLATNLGTIAGGVAGNQVAQNVNANRNTRTGVEYTIDLGRNGIRTIVQNLNAGEAALPAGSACVVSGSGSKLRVRGI